MKYGSAPAHRRNTRADGVFAVPYDRISSKPFKALELLFTRPRGAEFHSAHRLLVADDLERDESVVAREGLHCRRSVFPAGGRLLPRRSSLGVRGEASQLGPPNTSDQFGAACQPRRSGGRPL